VTDKGGFNDIGPLYVGSNENTFDSKYIYLGPMARRCKVWFRRPSFDPSASFRTMLLMEYVRGLHPRLRGIPSRFYEHFADSPFFERENLFDVCFI